MYDNLSKHVNSLAIANMCGELHGNDLLFRNGVRNGRLVNFKDITRDAFDKKDPSRYSYSVINDEWTIELDVKHGLDYRVSKWGMEIWLNLDCPVLRDYLTFPYSTARVNKWFTLERRYNRNAEHGKEHFWAIVPRKKCGIRINKLQRLKEAQERYAAPW